MTSDDAVFRERLTAYLDDQLPPAEAREFLALLERDPVAMRRLEEARRVWALLGVYRDEPVPEGFAERVLARVEGEEGPRAAAAAGPSRYLLAGGRRRVVAAAAAVLVALGAGTLFVLRDRDGAGGSSASLAALEAVPAGLLDSLDGDSLTRLAALSDDEFDALLAADPQDLAAAGRTAEPR